MTRRPMPAASVKALPLRQTGVEPTPFHQGGDRNRADTLAVWGLGTLIFMTLNWVFVFYYMTGLFFPSAGNVGHQAGYFLAAGLGVYSAATTRGRRINLLPPVTMAAALLWCWVSVAWAIDPDTSVRKLTLTSCVIVTAFIVVPQVGYQRTVAIMRWQALATLALCYLMVVLWPAAGIQQRLGAGTLDEVGGWRGIMVDKNSCGAFCAIMILLFLFDAGKLRPWLRWGALAAAVVFLVGTRSKTAMGIVAGVVPLGLLLTRYNSVFRLLLVPAILCALTAVALSWTWLLSPFQSALYDPQAFTGRGPIWATLLGYIRDHWLFGAGYGSFWGIGPRSPVFAYTDLDWVQALFVGHNGYLDVWSQIGLLGLLLVLLAVFVVPIARILKSRKLAPSRTALLIVILLFTLGDNVTESTLFDRDTLLNVIVMIVVALIAPSEREGRPVAGGAGVVLREETLRSRHRVDRSARRPAAGTVSS